MTKFFSGTGTFVCVVSWVGLLGLSCATSGVPLDELSDQPIALVYWDEATSRKRAESQRSEREAGMSRPGRRGVAELSDVVGLMGGGASDDALSEVNTQGRIVLLNPRTLEITPLAAAPRNARPLAWSNGREKLLYNSPHGDGGIPQLYEFHFGRGEVRKLTSGPRYHLEADYAPEEKIIYNWIDVRPSSRGSGLAVRSVKGGTPVPVTVNQLPSGPRWSPAGDVIVYFRADDRGRRRDESKIMVQKPDLRAKPLIVGRGREPDFFPDGDWIVYASQGASGWRLSRVRPDGSGRSLLGKSHLNARWPTVSPDGRHVAYISNADGMDRLYVRRFDGTGDRILLEAGSVAFPVW
ncbi:MAG: hypothetical protein CL917_02895 [Deltaproteobacteria bacterium]|nr:hypothetical protein [Deltaproteobacteria bacterium]